MPLPMHDVGKIGIPDGVLMKAGKLTADEFKIIKLHTVIGSRILSGTTLPLLELAKEIAISHHERWDGYGYPLGLKGSDIPLSGRIVAITDVFDAITSKECYKEAWPIEQGIGIYNGHEGKTVRSRYRRRLFCNRGPDNECQADKNRCACNLNL